MTLYDYDLRKNDEKKPMLLMSTTGRMDSVEILDHTIYSVRKHHRCFSACSQLIPTIEDTNDFSRYVNPFLFHPVPTFRPMPSTDPLLVVEELQDAFLDGCDHQWVDRRFAGSARHAIQQRAIPLIDRCLDT